MRRRPRAGHLAGCVLVGFGLAGCSGVENLSVPNPPATTVYHVTPSAATLPGNLSSVNEPTVPGGTTTTLPAIRPGQATLTGSVFGPTGPVGGATVEADRIVGNAFASVTTTTAADGSWTIADILGGRYRIRAWQAPALALTTPQVLFLGASQSATITLQLNSFKNPQVTMAISPKAPQMGQMANLVIEVTQPKVGSDGVVGNTPIRSTSVTLTNGSGWLVYNGNPLKTNAGGEVLFEVSCQTVGADPLSATLSSGTTVLPMPACQPTTTSTSTSTSSTVPCIPPTTQYPNEPTTTTTLVFGSC